MKMKNREIPGYKIKGVSNQNLSGIPLGGIGTGTIELRADSRLHDWQIFNNRPWRGEKILMADDESRIVGPWESLMAIRIKEKNKPPLIRLLQKMKREEIEAPYIQYDIKNIREIRYNGEFPFINIEYDDKDPDNFPVKVELEAFSPFLPLDVKNSALPCAIFTFKVKNLSFNEVSSSLVFGIPNPIGFNNVSKRVKNDKVDIDGKIGINFSGRRIPENHPTYNGNMTLLCLNDAKSVSYLSNREHVPMRGPYIGIWESLKKTGDLPNLEKAPDYEDFMNLSGRIMNGLLKVISDFAKFKMMYFTMPDRIRRQGEFFIGGDVAAQLKNLERQDPKYREDLTLRWSKYIEFVVNNSRNASFKYKSLIEQNPNIINNPTEKLKALEASADVDEIVGKMFPLDVITKGQQGILCSKINLQPNEQKEVTFVLSWYFPNHIPLGGMSSIGHMYENWFSDSAQVAAYIKDNYNMLFNKSIEFKEALYNSTFDYWLKDSINAQLTSIKKTTFYDKKGNFSIWEGLGLAGIQTMDVQYYGSFPIVLLFPELEKSQLSLTKKFQLREDSPQYFKYFMALKENSMRFNELVEKDKSILSSEEEKLKTIRKVIQETGKDPVGRIPHYFPGTFDEVDEYLQIQNTMNFIIETYRDYLYLADLKFLNDFWPHVKMGIQQILKIHVIDESLGLPYLYKDEETNVKLSVQTYDAWDYQGYSIYVNTLWITCLIATIKMAEIQGESKYADNLKIILEKAQNSTESLLWNGEYYSLWKNPYAENKNRNEDFFIHADGLNGQWYANFLDFGYILNEERVKSMLYMISKYCKIPNEGLINGYYPDKYIDKVDKVNWNYQSASPWTGTEYCVASFFIQEGMVDDALEIIKNVYERYLRIGTIWKHIECGSHYSRALDVWCVLMDLEGYFFDATRNLLRFQPKINPERFQSVYANSFSWGILKQTRTKISQLIEIEVKEGTLSVSILEYELPLEAKSILDLKITKNDKVIDNKYSLKNNKLRIELMAIIDVISTESLLVNIKFE